MAERQEITADSVRIVRVFLASPGDLGEERRAAREAVEEINRIVARPAGFHVDLIGWEDTLSSAGRPQAIINLDLATCQMFIGMLWGRWGTPPDTSGIFTSGFQEEFHLVSERNSKSSEPHICLFFKDIDPSKIADPGPELSKVLAFKKKIIDEKQIYFDTFPNANAFAAKVRISVADFIQKLRRVGTDARSDLSAEDRISKSKSGKNKTSSDSSHAQSDRIDAEFLADLAQRLSRDDDSAPDALEIARLRNIAIARGLGQNDSLTLGPHDANLIFKERHALSLSAAEISSLAHAGLENWSHENSPLWSWLSNLLKAFPMWLIYSTAFGPDQRRIGAFRALAILRTPFIEDEHIRMEELEEYWFKSSVSDPVKNAALDYIKVAGISELDVMAETELGRNSYATRSAAFEAVLWARSRESTRAAAIYATGSSFDALRDESMKLVLSGMPELGDDELRTAIEHRSGPIRAKAIQILSSRKKLEEAQIRRFFGDASFDVRRSALEAFEAQFRLLSIEEAKSALVVPRQGRGLLLGNQSFDFEGEAALKQLKRSHLAQQSAAELQEAARADPVVMEDYYVAKAKAHFSLSTQELRCDIDDRFVGFWERMLKAVVDRYNLGESGAIAGILAEQQTFRRRTLMRDALDIIVQRGQRTDLQRLRRALDEDAADPRLADAGFLKRWGSSEDIPRIARIASDYRVEPDANSLLSFPADMRPFASAILKLSANNVSDTLQSDLPDRLMAALIAMIPITAFRKLSRPTIESLLLKDSPAVRKASALQILRCLRPREARVLLANYLKRDQMYYNVVFWLDLLEEWDQSVCRDIAQRELRAS